MKLTQINPSNELLPEEIVDNIVYLKSKNCIINVEGGYGTELLQIWKYVFLQNEWKQVWYENIALHNEIKRAGVTVNGTKEYVFIARGLQRTSDVNKYHKSIIYPLHHHNVEKRIFETCSLKCPFKGCMEAICVYDDEGMNC